MRARPSALWALAALCVSLVGCSHYRLGTSGRLSFTTLYVAPVANKTLLPQAQAIVSTQLRDAFIRDGRVVLVDSPEQADAILSVTITNYHREIAAVLENGNGLASKFTLFLGATCTLRAGRDAKPLFENAEVEASRGSYTDNGVANATMPLNQLQSEYNTLPLLASDLAGKVAHRVLDVW